MDTIKRSRECDPRVARRTLPIGAESLDGGIHFRIWAPDADKVEIAIGAEMQAIERRFELEREKDGYYTFFLPEKGETVYYGYKLNGGENLYPDPASRFQPQGPHGPSQIVDPAAFAWTDGAWRGTGKKKQVIYEMHVGTFTGEGSWKAAEKELGELSSLGATIIEVMPVAEYSGRFGWGYDGVDLFAPTHLYGTPDDFRSFVNKAHDNGLGVILDVVYNHFGPDGNYLKLFSKDYFSTKYKNEWGEPVNFDGANSGPVREFYISNAIYWITEFHLDGLRFDATQQMFDASQEHILAAITRAVRGAGGSRSLFLVAENEPQRSSLVRPAEKGGYGFDALWNDDFHHSATVALTGRNEGYYSDYLGGPQELLSSVKRGYLFQGQYFAWQKKRRGTLSFTVPPETFVIFIQNHDQIANSGRGQRIHELTSWGKYKAMTALMILSPGTLMLFQGQEFASSSPFLYFADQPGELADRVKRGRAQFLSQFPSLASGRMRGLLADPSDPSTFERSKLDFSEREKNGFIYLMHKDLLRIKREDDVLRAAGAGNFDGAVLGAEAFLVRFFSGGDDDRLLLVNLGRDLRLTPAPEPLLAPHENKSWEMLWSSEDPAYRGNGTPEVETGECWRIPGQAAILLKPKTNGESKSWMP